jgi:excisionase family DNA binding protein
MKTELEPQDIEVIADKVIERLRPLISGNDESETGDIIFDVESLAQYLRVKEQWIYEKVHNNEIPHYKVGKYLRFRKSTIDDWLKKKEKGNGKKSINTVRRLLEDAA